jgi:hypothetical protein
MEEITIVKRRSAVWPILITLFLLALIVLAAVWMMGDRPVDVSFNQVIELGRRSTSGTA